MTSGVSKRRRRLLQGDERTEEPEISAHDRLASVVSVILCVAAVFYIVARYAG